MSDDPNPDEKAAPVVAALGPTIDEGIALYRAGDLRTAHAIFERCHRRATSDPRNLSWYGLTLVLVDRNSNLGMLYCDQAVRLAGPEPELVLNQARVHLAIKQRERAVRAIQRGLALVPRDAALLLARESIGWRRRPVFPCLRRSNPLNRWLGKLRHKWSRALHKPPEPTPTTLGLLPAGDDEGRREP